jgi:hypothetical protein
MNFLSHFYFHQEENHHYNCGLVLPDLVKNFCQARLILQADYKNDIKNALKSGSEQHQTADKIFHNSEFFNQANVAFASILNHHGNWPRKWFLNHLLVEILLDRALMDENPTLCETFYNHLNQVKLPLTIEFLKESGVKQAHSFDDKFKRFVNFPFIFDYQHNEKIIFALSRVYQKVGIEYEWTSTDKEVLLGHLPSLLEICKDMMPTLRDTLKK